MEGGKFYVTQQDLVSKRGLGEWLGKYRTWTFCARSVKLLLCLFIFYFVLSQVTGKKIVEAGFCFICSFQREHIP